MRLLIVTQKVDQNDPILGFFHGWIAEFAKHCDQVTVIALGVGEYHLPKNVRVFSLGKERGVSRLRYTLNFYRLIWREHKNYDTVFVHMNQEYVLLGGFLWKLLGKKITMWRNHYAGSFLTRIAMALSGKLFCTSKYSFTAPSKKTTLMPVGINTELFKKDDKALKKPNSILFLARFSPAKKAEIIIEALKQLRDDGVSFSADLYGNPAPDFLPYFESLKVMVNEYSLGDRVIFKQGITNVETVAVYGMHTVFINTSPSGMYDKTIFEAMACESLILTSNINLKGEIHEKFLFKENDPKDLAKKLKELLDTDDVARSIYGKELREYVVQKHSLSLLGEEIARYL